jgi:hypothetical protein
MKRIAVLVAAVVCTAAACSTDTEPVDLGAAPTARAPAPTSGPAGGTEITIWFQRDGELVPAVRTVPGAAEPTVLAAEAVRELIAGPTEAEERVGLGTEIPAATRLLDLTIGTDRVARVDLSAEFEAGGGTASVRSRVAQVACTLDDLVPDDPVDGTAFLLDGEPVEVSAARDPLVSEVVSCADLQPRPTTGRPGPECVHGWESPEPGDPRRTEALDLLRLSAGVDDRFVVEEMRWFRGPDAIEPALQVRYWYVKAWAESDPSFRGRFLLIRRRGSGGVVGVAAFHTEGWRSPDWAGFEGDGELTEYPDLPGAWGGVRYDFVHGTGGPGTPGLPDAVTGCLGGT